MSSGNLFILGSKGPLPHDTKNVDDLDHGTHAASRVGGRLPLGQERGWSGGRHCTAGQYGSVPLGSHLVLACDVHVRHCVL